VNPLRKLGPAGVAVQFYWLRRRDVNTSRPSPQSLRPARRNYQAQAGGQRNSNEGSAREAFHRGLVNPSTARSQMESEAEILAAFIGIRRRYSSRNSIFAAGIQA